VADYEPVLLANVNKEGSHTLRTYESAGGYSALKNILAEKTPADVVELVKASGLRGRGGAGFPAGMKWSFLPKDHPGPIYMCVNADESEPGTFNNRILMELDPHQVLEGTIIACYATRATTAYIYLRYEYPLAYERMQTAINECYAAGYLGRRVCGKDFSLDVYIHRGAAAYICGEETGLIESLEGKRAWPRIKPPFPAVEGLFRKPTVVNNIETLACVTHIAARGADWFKSIGVPADPKNPRDLGSYGPKLYCLSGHVNRPGCYEAPLGISCRQLIDEFGEGVWKGRKAKAAIPGGISMGLLTEAEFDTPLDFNGPVKPAAWGWAPLRLSSWMRRRASSTFCTIAAAFLPTKAVASAPLAVKERPGRCACWIAFEPAVGACATSISYWRSPTRSALSRAPRSAAWRTARLGPLRTESGSFVKNVRTTSNKPIRRATWKQRRWRPWNSSGCTNYQLHR